MTKRRRSLLAKVFGIGPKPASKRRRPELPETSDEAELRKYIRRWSVDQLRRELRAHPERLADVRDQVLEALIRDERPIEERIFEEELAHDPKLRQELKYLVFQKLRRELSNDQGASQHGQAAPVNIHNQTEQQNEFIRLARQLLTHK